MDPLLTLVSLSTNIVHFEGCPVNDVFLCDNSGGSHTGEKHILLGSDVIVSHDTVHFPEVGLYGLDNLELSTALPCLLNSWIILPKGLDGGTKGHVDLSVVVRRGHRGEVRLVFRGNISLIAEGGTVLTKHLHGGDGVGVNDGGDLSLLLLRERSSVKDTHLLEDGGLSRLSSTEQQQLNLLLLFLECIIHCLLNLAGGGQCDLLLLRHRRSACAHV
mmetsp:Transcript_6469/g.12945  ORF Transcript_6469/g.12945 Transcript_6469/m.12945 type:complete len:217 (-) Transcript_6469:12-662(-)